MQFLEQLVVAEEFDTSMEETMLESLMEAELVLTEGENGKEKWAPPKEYFTERKKLMDKIWKWAKADEVEKNKKKKDKIYAKINSDASAVALPQFKCDKSVKADTISNFMTSQGFSQAGKVANALGGASNLRYKGMFFAKRLKSGDYIEMKATASRSKDPTSSNSLLLLIGCTRASAEKSMTKLYKDL